MSDSEKWSKCMFLYVLECEKSKYYIGTAYDIIKRIKTHLNKGKKSAVFTKIYAPLKCIELFKMGTESRDEAELLENYKTIEYAVKFGAENVAGGNFTERDDLRRKKAIGNVITHQKLNFQGKEYKIDDKIPLEKLKEWEIKEIKGIPVLQIIEKISLNNASTFNSNPTSKYLSFDEVSKMASHIECLKHKALVTLCLIYTTKVSRMVKLKFENIHREDMMIDIPKKYNKSISVPMEGELLKLMETYYKAEKIKPKVYLFGGNVEGHHWGGGDSKEIIFEINSKLKEANKNENPSNVP